MSWKSQLRAGIAGRVLKCALQLIFFVCLLNGPASENFAQEDQVAEKEVADSDQPKQDVEKDEKANEDADEADYSEMTLDEIGVDFRTKMRAYMKRYQAAPTRREKTAVAKSIPRTTVYRSRMIELINEQAGSEEGLEVVDWWYRRGGRTKDQDVISRLILKHYSELESIEKYVSRVRWHLPIEEAEEQLKSLVKVNPFDAVKATAAYELHELFRTQAKELEEKSAEAIEAEVKTWRELIFDQYANAADTKGAKFVDLIEAVEFAAKLEIGQSAPDIVGTDMDGVEFRLSDYDGKVRVISFWGDW